MLADPESTTNNSRAWTDYFIIKATDSSLQSLHPCDRDLTG